jgi:hypothetical protein
MRRCDSQMPLMEKVNNKRRHGQANVKVAVDHHLSRCTAHGRVAKVEVDVPHILQTACQEPIPQSACQGPGRYRRSERENECAAMEKRTRIGETEFAAALGHG